MTDGDGIKDVAVDESPDVAPDETVLAVVVEAPPVEALLRLSQLMCRPLVVLSSAALSSSGLSASSGLSSSGSSAVGSGASVEDTNGPGGFVGVGAPDGNTAAVVNASIGTGEGSHGTLAARHKILWVWTWGGGALKTTPITKLRISIHTPQRDCRFCLEEMAEEGLGLLL
jgi:hypothetical protein